jgi:hypothetical protein
LWCHVFLLIRYQSTDFFISFLFHALTPGKNIRGGPRKQHAGQAAPLPRRRRDAFPTLSSAGEGEEEVFLNDGAGFAAPIIQKDYVNAEADVALVPFPLPLLRGRGGWG